MTRGLADFGVGVTMGVGVALFVAGMCSIISVGEAQSAMTVQEECSLPTDPMRRCAVKALRGDYGELQAWQREGYEAALRRQPLILRAWVTTYYPSEGFPRGQMCRWGIGVSERVAAANKLPPKTWVWHPRTGIRQVWDTGAHSNDRRASRLGADLWIDFWEPRKGMLFGDDNASVQKVWIVKRSV